MATFHATIMTLQGGGGGDLLRSCPCCGIMRLVKGRLIPRIP